MTTKNGGRRNSIANIIDALAAADMAKSGLI
jgi:hypothetical protein